MRDTSTVSGAHHASHLSPRSVFNRFVLVGSRGRYPLWTAAALLLVAAVTAPYLPLVVNALSGGGESWEHVRITVLRRYVTNTVLLVGLTAAAATTIGAAGAWILERYDLPAKRALEILFIAPLALPAYIGTFTYSGIFAFGGPVYRATGLVVPFTGMGAAVFVLTMALYPYVYLTVRAALMANTRTLFEVVASLSGTGGRARSGYRRRVWRGVLPSLRPALVGGAGLIAMEVMNAYATPVYLGIQTLSTGVFRTWFGLNDLETATTLAAIVLAGMLALIGLEQYGRGRRRYAAGGGAPPQTVSLSTVRKTMLVAGVVLPAAAGFVVPVLQLAWWTVLSAGTGIAGGLGLTVVRTIALAAAATATIVGIALLLNMAAYLRPGRLMNGVMRVAGIGYAVPGTVVAIGVLAVFRSLSLIDQRLFLFGTVAGLLFAYAARYLAVAVQPVQAGFARQHRSTVDAARSLGSGPFRILTHVVLPVFRPTLAGAALLVAIDVIKDLPMTLLLRPFDFDTLAVQVYRLASDERMPEAAPRALLLVAVGILTIWVIMKPSGRTTVGLNVNRRAAQGENG